MTYNEFVTALVTMLDIADATGQTAFNSVIARCIAYAELRLQREFDFLATRAVDFDHMTIGGTRLVAIPENFIVLEGVSLITPSAYKPYMQGARRVSLQRATRQFIDFIWPVETEVRSPDPLAGGYYAVFSQHQDNTADAPAPGSADQLAALPSAIIIAPTPDDEYVVEQTGTIRATPLSASNTTTFISEQMEDIFLAAALKWGFAYQRDFGAASNNPQAAQSWENEYRILAQNLDTETLRQKAAIAGFSPYPTKQVVGLPTAATAGAPAVG